MKWYFWVILAVVAIFAVDLGLAHFAEWRKRRDEFIRNERLHRFNVTAFRGTRKFDDPRWKV